MQHGQDGSRAYQHNCFAYVGSSDEASNQWWHREGRARGQYTAWGVCASGRERQREGHNSTKSQQEGAGLGGVAKVVWSVGVWVATLLTAV